MKLKTLIYLLTLAGMTPGYAAAQRHAPQGGPAGSVQADTWEVNIKNMPGDVRNEITETFSRLKGTEQDRGILSDIGSAVGMGLVSGMVDVVFTETYNLMQYNKRQKQEWMKMIQNENNYTDSITSIKGLNDFYSANSSKGALDPSDMNFDGIEIRGIKNGQQVIYMSCSIDRDRLDNLFRHSKFNLVLDTLAFNPYVCHLPNVTANGIRTMNEMKKGKVQLKGDTILRPGAGGNGFSFDERNNLRVAIDFSLTSSWINQAVQVHKNVELGKFSFNIEIPDNVIGVYTYSREAVLKEAEELPEGHAREEYLKRNLLTIEGDSFVVPRSYMPVDGDTPMWGTGEYNIKVKVRESCQFDNNSDKAKHWKEDYKRLRKMQRRSGEVQEYLQTLWNQHGNTLVKSSYKTALSTVAKDLSGQLQGGGGSSSRSGASAQGNKSAQTPTGAPAGGMPSK